MNKAQIIGNLGKDPEVKTMQNGDKVCSLAVATSESWKDKTSGERKEITEWHRISIFNPHLIEVAEKFLRKGSKVYIEGQIKTRKWQDQQGQDKYTTEIILGRFQGAVELLDRPPERSGEPAQQQTAPEYAAAPPNPIDLDDEIPF